MEMVATTSLPCALLPHPGKGSVAAGGVASTRRLLYNKSKDALEPHISQETMSYHWGKHLRGYVEGLNNQIVWTDLEGVELENIITRTYNKGNILPSFNNAAQMCNHDLFWESMYPNGGGKPSGSLLEFIERDFGFCEKITQRFTTAASTQFGSGWIWLAYKEHRLDVDNAVRPCPSEEDKKLVIVKSPNAVNPLVWNYSSPRRLHIYLHGNARFMESCELTDWRWPMLEPLKGKQRKSKSKERRTMDDKAVEMYLDSESDESEAE